MTIEEKIAYIMAAIDAQPELVLVLFKGVLYQTLPMQPEARLDFFISVIDT